MNETQCFFLCEEVQVITSCSLVDNLKTFRYIFNLSYMYSTCRILYLVPRSFNSALNLRLLQIHNADYCGITVKLGISLGFLPLLCKSVVFNLL